MKHTAQDTYLRVARCYPFLKQLVPPNRLENSYCRWTQAVGRDYNFIAPYDNDRYCAVNWRAYSEHGTLEFRCQSGSTLLTKIEKWALVCRHLVDVMSAKAVDVPTSWNAFVALFPKELRTWVDKRAKWCAKRRKEEGGNLYVHSSLVRREESESVAQAATSDRDEDLIMMNHD